MDRERTLILIPISPMEEHGPHLPIGTDVMAAADIAARTANQLENKAPAHAVVLCPAVPWAARPSRPIFPGPSPCGARP